MTAAVPQDKIIQIGLSEYKHSITPKWLFGLGLLLLVTLGSIAYWYFRINLLLLLLGCVLLSIVFSFLCYQSAYNTSAYDTTLVIAFGEFQLMKNKQILWSEKIDHLDIHYYKYSNYQIPIVVIKGATFSKISIGYGRPKIIKQKQELDYLIFSKLNWKILLQYTQIAIITAFKNDKILTK